MTDPAEPGAKTLWRRLNAALGSPYTAAIATFVSFYAALLGSLYSTEIKQALPSLVGVGPWQDASGWFWFLAAVGVLLFLLNQRAGNKERIAAETRLLKRTHELESLLTTLPPADFLSYFREAYSACFSAYKITDKSITNTNAALTLEQAIRYILYQSLTMLKRFESDNRETNYGASIMVYRSVQDVMQSGNGDSFRKDLQFCPPETDFPKLKGCLELVLDLSVMLAPKSEVRNIPDLVPDHRLKRLVLPLPQEVKTRDEKLWRVLPGAPHAFCTNTIRGFLDTAQLESWCSDFADLPKEVVGQMRDYFRSTDGEHIQSFVSVPLTLPSEDVPIGILNLHSSRKDLLGSREPEVHLWPLYYPFRFMLTELLHAWILAESNHQPLAQKGEQNSAQSV